jgi:hypothetical protein
MATRRRFQRENRRGAQAALRRNMITRRDSAHADRSAGTRRAEKAQRGAPSQRAATAVKAVRAFRA